MSLDALRNNLPSISSIKSAVGMAPEIPKTHKAALFKEKGGPLVIEQVETKHPQEGEILIKVLACGVCHSDSFAQAQAYGTPFPLVPGHETIGNVVAVGPGEKNVKVGDRVGGPWHGGHDGTCRMCKKGYNQMCPNAAVNGVTREGGYQEYTILRSEAVVHVPSEVDPAAYAPILCAGVTVFNSMRHMNIPSGEVVGIQGLGGLGHLAVQYAARMGFRVVALSSSGSKEKFARELGAMEYIDGSKESHPEGLQKLGGAAMIVCTAPNPEIMGDLLNGLAPFGKLLLLSPVMGIKIDSLPLIGGGRSIYGWPSGQALDSEEAIEFAQHHNVNCMIEKYPLDKANEAYEDMMAGKPRFRNVLVME